MQTRHSFLASGAAVALALGIPRIGSAAPGKNARLSPDEALAALREGNERFIAGKPRHTDLTVRREEVAGGQHPFAMVLTCSDSRVPPELIFDQGLGDLFIVRIAGNFAEEDGIGSLEYAAAHFGCSVLMVLGHTSCGAIHATVDALKSHTADIPGNIADIVKALTPAAQAGLREPGDAYANATAENVRRSVQKLKSQPPILASAVTENRLRVVGGIYDLKSGRVNHS